MAAGKPSADLSSGFRKFYSGGELIPIVWRAVPALAAKHFESRSAHLVHPDKYRPYMLDEPFRILHDNSDRTYVTTQQKLISFNGGRDYNLADFAYFITMRGDAEVGYATLCKDLADTPQFEGYPFGWYLSIERAFRRNGFAERLCDVMNAFALARHGLLYFSDTTIASQARAMYEKMMRRGKVEAVEHSSGRRDMRAYRYTNPAIAANA